MKALFVYVLLCIIFPFAAGPRLVLFDLKNLGVPGVLSEVASSMIRTRLVKSGKFTVLERKYLDSLFREQGESLKAEYSEEFRLRLGQMLSAEKAAAGYISPIGDDIIISLRLIDIETGNVEISNDIIFSPDPASFRYFISNVVKKTTDFYKHPCYVTECDSSYAVISCGENGKIRPGMEIMVLRKKELIGGFSEYRNSGRLLVEKVNRESALCRMIGKGNIMKGDSAVLSNRVTYKSEPPGAVVYSDSGYVGITPVTVYNIMPGNHFYRMEKKGRGGISGTFSISPGENLIIKKSFQGVEGDSDTENGIFALFCRHRGMLPVSKESGEDFCIDKYEYPNKKGETPLSGISYFDARRLCRQENKRLCSPEQWYLACSGGGKRVYPYGNSYMQKICNTGSHIKSGKPVISGERDNCLSAYGIMDMSGNLAEWISGGGDSHTGRAAGGAFSSIEGGAACSSVRELKKEGEYESVGFRCCTEAVLRETAGRYSD